MPLWYKDYFELKAIEKKQMQEKLAALPLSTRKGKTILIIRDNSRLINPELNQKIYIANLTKTTHIFQQFPLYISLPTICLP